LGVLLIVGCFAYLAVSFTSIVFPEHRQVMSQVMPCPTPSGMAMIVWLVVKGAKEANGGAPAVASP
jgi:hypothetical protein